MIGKDIMLFLLITIRLLQDTQQNENNTLSWEFTPKKNKIYFSYYIPFSLSKNYKLTSKLSKRSGVKKKHFGKSPLKNKIREY